VRLRPGHLVLGALGLAVGLAGVMALREATLSTHQVVEPDSETVVVVRAEEKGGEPGQTLPEMVDALLATCRLEISSDLSGPVTPLGDGEFRALLVPALDETNERQFRGCVEDWTIDHLRVDVLDLEELERDDLDEAGRFDGDHGDDEDDEDD